MLLCSAWVLAQSGSNAGSSAPSQTGSPTASQASDSNSTTIEGCLAGSAGSFTLTDTAGKTYSLQGDTSKLSSEVGHQVRIKGSEAAGSASGSAAGGNPSSAGGNPSGGASSGASAAVNFDVKSVRKVSDTCTPPSK